MKSYDVVIIGGGISGLTAAYYLKKHAVNFCLLEKSNRAGGALHSEKQGAYALERGANTVAMNAELFEIIQELGLEDSVETPHTASHKRYIYRDGQLHSISQHPLSLLKSSLLSRGGKFRLAREPFVSSTSPEGESVAEFFSRRLGTEAYEYLVAAGLQGIYAGIPEEMNMQAVMPALVEMEIEKGSLLKGLIARQKEAKKTGAPKRSIFSFKQGMEQLPGALAQNIASHTYFNSAVHAITKSDEGYLVETSSASFSASKIIYAAPAHAASMWASLAPGLTEALRSIPYAPMALLHLAYPTSSLGRPCDGFGFLIPPKEKTALLGAIWNSALFKERAKEGQHIFTLFVGGASQPQLHPQDSAQHFAQARREFEEIMKINQGPTFEDLSFWQQAIPQYGHGHLTALQQIEEAQTLWPGIHFIGNYLQGVSVGDCIKRAKNLVLTQMLN